MTWKYKETGSDDINTTENFIIVDVDGQPCSASEIFLKLELVNVMYSDYYWWTDAIEVPESQWSD